MEKRTRGALRNLLLLGPEMDADTFSLRYASHEAPDGEGACEIAALQMREHLSRQGIRGLCPAVCVSKPKIAAQGWTERIDVADDLWANISSQAAERVSPASTFYIGPRRTFWHHGCELPKAL